MTPYFTEYPAKEIIKSYCQPVKRRDLMSEVIPAPAKFAHLVLKTSRFNEQRRY